MLFGKQLDLTKATPYNIVKSVHSKCFSTGILLSENVLKTETLAHLCSEEEGTLGIFILFHSIKFAHKYEGEFYCAKAKTKKGNIRAICRKNLKTHAHTRRKKIMTQNMFSYSVLSLWIVYSWCSRLLFPFVCARARLPLGAWNIFYCYEAWRTCIWCPSQAVIKVGTKATNTMAQPIRSLLHSSWFCVLFVFRVGLLCYRFNVWNCVCVHFYHHQNETHVLRRLILFYGWTLKQWLVSNKPNTTSYTIWDTFIL